jgi:glycosyltransferase involved in cell wall biosynthesis
VPGPVRHAPAGGDRAPAGPDTTVLHLITTLTQGGAERMLSQLVPRPGESAGGRHLVVSLAPGGMFADALTADGVEVRDLGMRPGRDLVRGTSRLLRLMREVDPDVMIAWMYHACLLAWLVRLVDLRRARRARRLVWVLRGALHTEDGLPWHTRLIVRLLALLSRSPEAIAVNSAAGREHHTAAGYRPRRWVSLPNGCDTAAFRPDSVDRHAVRTELGLPADATVLIAVGRDHPQKDHASLLAAFAQARSQTEGLELLLVGAGTERHAGQAGPGVHALGLRRDVPRLLRAADVMVSSSTTEGLPNALLEAMATGLPVVATDVGDCRSLVGDAGRIIMAGDREALAHALRELVGLGAAGRAELGARARERVEQHHSLTAARRDYRELWSRTPTEQHPDGCDTRSRP